MGAIILLQGTPDSHDVPVNAHCARKCSDVYGAGYTALYSVGENVYLLLAFRTYWN
jgi:hypothetical protein